MAKNEHILLKELNEDLVIEYNEKLMPKEKSLLKSWEKKNEFIPFKTKDDAKDLVKFLRRIVGFWDVRVGIDVSDYVEFLTLDGKRHAFYKNTRQLDVITEIITNYTPFSYAEKMLEKEKANFSLTIMNGISGEIKHVRPDDYYEYMRQTWHWEEKPPLEECIEKSRMSKLEAYANAIKMYTGWVKNGKLFVLNRKEKFVSFLYEVVKDGNNLDSKPQTVSLHAHYNPLNVDCFEESMSHKYLFDQVVNGGHYDISTDENRMITECDLLIKYEK